MSKEYGYLWLYPDSVVAVKWESDGRGSTLQYFGRVIVEKDTVLQWRREDEINRIISDPYAEYDLVGEPGAWRVGRQLHVFDTAGRTWWISGLIAPRWERAPFRWAPYLAVASLGDSLRPTLYAVVDNNLRFVVAPQPDFEFLGGDRSQGYFIVRPVRPGRPLCGVVDTQFRWIVRPQRRFIGAYFKWKGRKYLIGAHREGVPVFSLPLRRMTGSSSFDDRQRYDSIARERFYRHFPEVVTLLDERGRIVLGFDSVYDLSFFSYDGKKLTAPQSDVMQVKQFYTGKVGFLTFKGAVVFPALHYKYLSVRFLGRHIAICEKEGGGSYRIVSTDGKSLLPAIDGRLRFVDYGERIFQDLNIAPPDWEKGLLAIHYAADDHWKSPAVATMLIDLHGTVYADADAIR